MHELYERPDDSLCTINDAFVMIKKSVFGAIRIEWHNFGPRNSRSGDEPDNRKPLKDNSETLFWDVG